MVLEEIRREADRRQKGHAASLAEMHGDRQVVAAGRLVDRVVERIPVRQAGVRVQTHLDERRLAAEAVDLAGRRDGVDPQTLIEPRNRRCALYSVSHVV